MSLAELTVIPSRKLLTDPGWLGLFKTLHVLPFQCSMSVCVVELLLEKKPTAQISLAETAATLLSSLNVGAPELAMKWFWKAFQDDELAFASVVVRDRDCF